MTAVGRHFGSQVSLYSIWNEPNHPAFLLPQWNSNGTPASPRIYRGLYQAGYAGLQAAGHGPPEGAARRDRADRLQHASTCAREKSRALLHDVAPLAFLRGALCLNAHYAKVGLVRAAAGGRLRPPRLHDCRRAAATVRRSATT